METEISEKLMDLAAQLSYASGVKEAARIRRQVSSKEWDQIREEAKKIVARRRAAIPNQQARRA